jgi:hypothetical protein
VIEEYADMSHVTMDTTAFVLIVADDGEVRLITKATPEYVQSTLAAVSKDVRENGFQYT